jgi:hypothetical protein
MQTQKPANTQTAPQDKALGSADGDGNVAASGSNDINAASTPDGTSKTARIQTRIIQLKTLLQDQSGEYASHIRSEADLEEFEEATALLDADDQRSHMADGYPDTEVSFDAHCRCLFEAMRNLDDIDEAVAAPPAENDQPGTPARKDSPAVKFIKSKKAIEVNIVAAKLMVSNDHLVSPVVSPSINMLIEGSPL